MMSEVFNSLMLIDKECPRLINLLKNQTLVMVTFSGIKKEMAQLLQFVRFVEVVLHPDRVDTLVYCLAGIAKSIYVEGDVLTASEIIRKALFLVLEYYE